MCNPSALEEEAGGSCIKVQPRLLSESKARVGCKEILCHTDERKEKEKSGKGNGRGEVDYCQLLGK